MALPKPIITEADVHAVRACIEGTADADQQRRAMRWIGEQACQMKTSPALFVAGDRDLLVGMQHVAHTIADMTIPATLAEAIKHDAGRRRLVNPRGTL